MKINLTRRSFLGTITAAAAAGLIFPRSLAHAVLTKKITLPKGINTIKTEVSYVPSLKSYLLNAVWRGKDGTEYTAGELYREKIKKPEAMARILVAINEERIAADETSK